MTIDQSDLELEKLVNYLQEQNAPSDLCHHIVLARIEALRLVEAPISPFLQALEAHLNHQAEREDTVIRGLKALDELGL